MNPVQISTTLAPIISFVAGLLASRQVFGWDAGVWATVIGSLLAAGATIWNAVTTTKTSLITTVANAPEVASVKLTAAAPEALKDNTPSNVT